MVCWMLTDMEVIMIPSFQNMIKMVEIFTRQLAPFVDDGAFSMSLNTDGDVFLAGFTKSAIAPDEALRRETRCLHN